MAIESSISLTNLCHAYCQPTESNIPVTNVVIIKSSFSVTNVSPIESHIPVTNVITTEFSIPVN